MTVYHYCRGELHSPFHDTDSFPYLRNASAKRRVKSYLFRNNPQGQTEDVLFNLINPDSEIERLGQM
jgi:hypothetical protein